MRHACNLIQLRRNRLHLRVAVALFCSVRGGPVAHRVVALRHRLVLSYEALSDNVSSDDLLKKIIGRVPVPVVPLHERSNVRVNA